MNILPHRVGILAIAVLSFAGQAKADENAAKPARKPVKLPGVLVDFQKRCVDLDAVICLDEGFLELIACAQGGKEHESIVAVSARAMHIHAALLLLEVNNGHPAMRKQVGEKEKRWVNVPPKGDPVDVFLVVKKDGKAIERPISDFVVHSNQRVDEVDGEVIVAPDGGPKKQENKAKRLPHTFLFAGSRLRDNGPGPRQYLADLSGHLISIATFGDELLCLPFHQTRENDALTWRIRSGSLPQPGTKVALRLRPHKPQPPKPQPPTPAQAQ